MSQDEVPPPPTNTPPNSQSQRRSYIKETPRKPPLASDQDYQSRVLEKERNALIRDTGYIPEVPIDYFIDSVLPILPNADDVIKTVVGKLRLGRHLESTEKGMSWTAFQTRPSAASGHEDKVFEPFNRIWSAITKFGKTALALSPTVEFKQMPRKAPISERPNQSIPDGQCVLADPGAILEALELLHSYYATVVSWEFKRKNTADNIIDNIRKVIWSCHNTLRADARRRFTFGITVEDGQTRIWYFSRSCAMATKPFDFIEDPRTLIRVILSLAFSSLEHLGFDPTVALYVEPREPNIVQFTFRVGDKTYVTCERPLADYSADAIRGRGMRVFKVYELDSPTVFLVLKDVWILRDSLLEGDQLRQLHERMENIEASPGGRPPTDYFLTVVSDGLVALSGGIIDDTLEVMMRGMDVPADCGQIQTRKASVIQSRQSQTANPTSVRGSNTMTYRDQSNGLHTLPVHSPEAVQVKYSPRRHYRIVFKEVGITANHVVSLAQLANALIDVTNALKVLHDLGFVHRDVSPTNILLVDDVGKLSDLEYLKPIQDDVDSNDGDSESELLVNEEQPEHKTGNVHFSAVEVVDSTYRFQNPGFGDDTEGEFRFNPLHDLESVTWIALHAILCQTPGGVQDPHLLTLADRYFGQNSDAAHLARIELIRGQAPKKLFRRDLFEPLVWSHLTVFAEQQADLRKEYTKFESGTHQGAYRFNLGSLYASFISKYRTIAEDPEAASPILGNDGTSDNGALDSESEGQRAGRTLERSPSERAAKRVRTAYGVATRSGSSAGSQMGQGKGKAKQ
ncbi:hypothetical protein C8R46DRAFT_1075652 [Mycena filopes]|nr:hypothetical protein C8R46DRAFT_1075652 [Mycena filopes]